MLSKEQIFELFNTAEKKQYQKRGRFLFRLATAPETVLTIVSGKLETIKTAVVGDIVLRNIEIGSFAETYIVSEDTFKKRYDVVVEPCFVHDKSFTERYNPAQRKVYWIDNIRWCEAKAKGQIDAFRYERDDPFEFMAPWNELMLCEKGDYIARPIGGDENDIYRIEKNTFQQTYTLIEENING